MSRALVVTNMYPPHHYGGYELSCRDCVERWRDAGHEVMVLTSTMRVPGVPDPGDEPGVVRALRIYFRDGDLHAPPVPVRLAWEWANQRVLRRVLRDFAPDVVSVWHMGAMSTGLLTTLVRSGVRCVYMVCDDWLLYGRDLDAWARLFPAHPRLARLAPVFDRLCGVPCGLPADLGRSGRFLFVSELVRRRSLTMTPWEFPDTAVVGSGIDTADFPVPGEPPPPKPWSWRLLYVGRLDPRKGIETLLAALARLPSAATLSVVGDGPAPYRARLAGVVDRAGLTGRVRFTVVPRAELRALYTGADAVVFPSEWEEPFGLVPLEAMACATPVVATRTGGSAEFLDDGVNCLAFPPGDADALAAALRRLAAEPELRARLVAGGIATAARFTTDRLAAVIAEHLFGPAGAPTVSGAASVGDGTAGPAPERLRGARPAAGGGGRWP